MISVRNVCHTYNPKSNQEILHHVSMDIPDGKFVLLLGQSGSGKTTLLNIIAGLMKPTSGTVISEGESLYEKTTAQLCDYRSKHVGFCKAISPKTQRLSVFMTLHQKELARFSSLLITRAKPREYSLSQSTILT